MHCINDETFKEKLINFISVHSIYLSQNKIERVSESAFAGCQRLEIIYLDGNRIGNILFKAEDIPKLETLNIKDNQLTKLPIFYGVFQSFKEINVAGNRIANVYAGDFENITGVEAIDLSLNGLSAFEPRHELSGLSVLDLANNRLPEIPNLEGTYNSLQQIFLQHNNISLRSLLALKNKIHGSEQSLTSLFLGGNEDFANNLFAVTHFLEQFPNLFRIGFSSLKISDVFTDEQCPVAFGSFSEQYN